MEKGIKVIDGIFPKDDGGDLTYNDFIDMLDKSNVYFFGNTIPVLVDEEGGEFKEGEKN